MTAEGGVTTQVRRPLSADGSAADLLGAIVDTARAVLTEPADWVVALPGPFDYAKGVARYALDKFTALNGFPLGSALGERLGGKVRFLNDADAFALGCWAAGPRVPRLVAITLGTGVGSGFVLDGAVVTAGPGVPPEGSAYLLSHREEPLESWVSRDAIRRGFLAAGGGALDVREICELARTGDTRAGTVLRNAMTVLAETLSPWLQRFAPERLVVGGSIAGSWELLGPWFAAVIPAPVVEVEVQTELAALRGAAWVATGQETASS